MILTILEIPDILTSHEARLAVETNRCSMIIELAIVISLIAHHGWVVGKFRNLQNH